jgi:hypothetical protein
MKKHLPCLLTALGVVAATCQGQSSFTLSFPSGFDADVTDPYCNITLWLSDSEGDYFSIYDVNGNINASVQAGWWWTYQNPGGGSAGGVLGDWSLENVTAAAPAGFDWSTASGGVSGANGSFTPLDMSTVQPGGTLNFDANGSYQGFTVQSVPEPSTNVFFWPGVMSLWITQTRFRSWFNSKARRICGLPSRSASGSAWASSAGAGFSAWPNA